MKAKSNLSFKKGRRTHQLGLEVKASTLKLFDNNLQVKFQPDKPVTQPSQYSTLYFCDLVNEIANQPLICNVIETFFLSQNGKPICVANCSPPNPIQLHSIQQLQTLTPILKDMLYKQFGFTGDFTNQVLIDFLSDPTKSVQTICHASYQDGTQLELTVKDLCKNFMQNQNESQVCFLSFASPKRDYLQYLCHNSISFEEQSQRQLNSKVSFIAMNNCQTQLSMKDQYEIQKLVQKCSDRLVKKIQIRQRKLVQILFVYRIEQVGLENGKFVPWLMSMPDCTIHSQKVINADLSPTRTEVLKSEYANSIIHTQPFDMPTSISPARPTILSPQPESVTSATQQKENADGIQQRASQDTQIISNEVIIPTPFEQEATIDKKAQLQNIEEQEGVEVVDQNGFDLIEMDIAPLRKSVIVPKPDQYCQESDEVKCDENNLYASLAIIANDYTDQELPKARPKTSCKKNKQFFKQQTKRAHSYCQVQEPFPSRIRSGLLDVTTHDISSNSRKAKFLSYLRKNSNPTEQYTQVFNFKTCAQEKDISLDTITIKSSQKSKYEELKDINRLKKEEVEHKATWWKNPSLQNCYFESQQQMKSQDQSFQLVERTGQLKNLVMKREIKRREQLQLIEKTKSVNDFEIEQITDPLEYIRQKQQYLIDLSKANDCPAYLKPRPRLQSAQNYGSRRHSSTKKPNNGMTNLMRQNQFSALSQLQVIGGKPVRHFHQNTTHLIPTLQKQQQQPQTALQSQLPSADYQDFQDYTIQQNQDQTDIRSLKLEDNFSSYQTNCEIKVFCNDTIQLHKGMNVTDQCFIDYNDASKVVKVILTLTKQQKDEFVEGFNKNALMKQKEKKQHDLMGIKRSSRQEMSQKDQKNLQPCCPRCFCMLTHILEKLKHSINNK